MTKRLATSAISMALTVVCLFASATLPTAKVFMFSLSSVFGAIIVYEYGVKYGLVIYLGVSILSLLLLPNKFPVFIYILFMGYYPMIKRAFDRSKNKILQWLYKMVFFNFILITAYLLFKLVLMPYFQGYPMVIYIFKYLNVVIAALEIFFIVYDLVLSYILNTYKQVIKWRI